jgi:hypothetical protein
MSKSKIDEIASELTGSFVKQLQEQIAKQVTADIAHKLAQIDIQTTVRDYVNHQLSGLIKNVNFPDASIPGSALDISSLRIHGDNIQGGIYKLFCSTGIQDTATECQVTILDAATVIENTLVVPDALVKGNLTIDGDLILTGEIPPDSPFYRELVEHAAGLVKLSLNDPFFESYSNIIFDRIKTEGLDLTKIKLDGNEILKGNTLGYFITDTNIQKVGELKNLQVNGEASLYNSLFARNNRVGINTEDPSAALAVWDEECEVSVKKLRKNTAFVGSTRNQSVVLSSNNHDNIVLETDGSVAIKKMNLGQIEMTSAAEQPKYNAKRGSVVFNEVPEIGQPLGWVSLGGARWANFGMVA